MRAIKRDGGVIRRPAAGQLGCCCIEGEPPTTQVCPDPLPDTIDIVISGISTGCGCYDDNVGGSYSYHDLLINGAHTLTNAGGSYSVLVSPGISKDIWLAPGCSSDFDNTFPLDVLISMGCSGGYWTVTIECDLAFFQGTGTANQPISNELDCASSHVATGGTVTISL